MTDKMRQMLVENGEMIANHPYIVKLNRQLNFRSSDPTVAYIEHERDPLDDFDYKGGSRSDGNDNSYNDFYAFDHHYLRYAKVLDTDYDNFVIMYSCQEAAEYFDPTDKSDPPVPIMSLEDIWEHVKRVPNPSRGESHMLTSYEVGKGITQKMLHKERVQILWRAPTVKEDVNGTAASHSADMDPAQLTAHLKTISEILPQFTKEVLESNYAPMNHAGNSKAIQDKDQAEKSAS